MRLLAASKNGSYRSRCVRDKRFGGFDGDRHADQRLRRQQGTRGEGSGAVAASSSSSTWHGCLFLTPADFKFCFFSPPFPL